MAPGDLDAADADVTSRIAILDLEITVVALERDRPEGSSAVADTACELVQPVIA